MMEPDIGKAISILCPKGVFSITENDYDRIDWQSPEVTQPSKSAIQAKLAELHTEYDAQEYARNRASAFPSIGDQLDLLWHAIDTGDWTAAKVKTTDFYTKLKKVKDDNPKPS